MPRYDLEMQRQDFLVAEPELYAYIRSIESARAYGSAAETAASAHDVDNAHDRLILRSLHARRHADALKRRPGQDVLELPEPPPEVVLP